MLWVTFYFLEYEILNVMGFNLELFCFFFQHQPNWLHRAEKLRSMQLDFPPANGAMKFLIFGKLTKVCAVQNDLQKSSHPK